MGEGLLWFRCPLGRSYRISYGNVSSPFLPLLLVLCTSEAFPITQRLRLPISNGRLEFECLATDIRVARLAFTGILESEPAERRLICLCFADFQTNKRNELVKKIEELHRRIKLRVSFTYCTEYSV